MAKFFINRPIVAIVISIVMTIVGVITYVRLPVAQFPDIVPPEIQVKTTYTGADALSVARTVSIPWDSAIRAREIRRANPWKNAWPRSKAERRPWRSRPGWP